MLNSPEIEDLLTRQINMQYESLPTMSRDLLCNIIASRLVEGSREMDYYEVTGELLFPDSATIECKINGLDNVPKVSSGTSPMINIHRNSLQVICNSGDVKVPQPHWRSLYTALDLPRVDVSDSVRTFTAVCLIILGLSRNTNTGCG